MRKLLAIPGELLFAVMLCLSLGTAQAEDATFSEAELDQMMAPIALYPDALLAQILMAATYPADVAEAVKWSKDNPDQDGDAAVDAVQDKSWDPSVMSLVAFPQVLAMAGEQPDWVQNVGDAFLADSEAVMDTVQTLRKKAKDEGNLKTSEQQKVLVEEPSTSVQQSVIVEAPSTTSETVIIIEPADPQVVYVPSYNPTVVYGTWWWPHYTPYYYRPVGYGFGSAVVRGIGFGIGVGITNALWGGCSWGRGRGSVDINVNRYNNINVNRNKIDASRRNTTWNHNSNNRRGVPYKDNKSREKFDNKRGGKDNRENFRGRDADRDKARQTLDKRGVDPAEGRKELKGSGGDKARDSVNKANRDVAQGKLGDRDAGKARDAAKNRDAGKTRDAAKSRDTGKARDAAKSRDTGKARDAAKSRDTGKARDAAKSRDTGKARDAAKARDHSSKQTRSHNNALKGSGNANKTRQNINRGQSSNRSMKSRSGGGGGRMGGGGGRGGGGRR